MPLGVAARCTGQRTIVRRLALSTEIDRGFMESLGFLEDGDGNDELGLTILSEGETEWDGEGPAHQLIWSSTDGSLFLEAFTGDGDSLAITEIPKPKTRGDVVQLLKLLGAYRPTLHDHVSRELKKHMPSCPSEFGTAVIDFIIAHRLFRTECPDSPESSVVITWSANAPEQIGEFVTENFGVINGREN